MIGVVKQEKSNGKLQQIDTIQFGNTQLAYPEPDYDIYEREMAVMPMARTSNANSGPVPTPMPMYDMMEEAEEESGSFDDSAQSSVAPAPTATFDSLIA